MLPPIPQSLVPVMALQDTPKPRPEIPPVTPTEESASESAISLDRRHPQEVQERWREAQRRRRHPSGAVQTDDEEPPALPEDLPRQGLWIDVEV